MGSRTSPMIAKAKAANARVFNKLYNPRPEAKKPKPYVPSKLEARRLEVSRRRYLLRSAGSEAVFMREELRPLASF